jgi:hypothetical protein
LLADRDIFHPTATKKFPLGARAESRDGRVWRYCEEAGNGLTKCQINQAAAGTGGWQNEVQTNNPSIAILGAKVVTVTLTTTAAKDAFIGAYLTIEDGTGENEMYVIKSNKVGTANATTGFDVVLEIADAGGIRVAFEAASELTITVNNYKDVIVFPTDPTGVCVGVNHVAVTASYFFWAQVHGPCAVTNGSDTIIVGDVVVAGAQAAGVLAIPDNGTASEGDTVVGHVMRAAGSGETALVFLNIE